MDENCSDYDLTSVSMPDYIIAAKQSNWGIDVNEFPKLKRMRGLDLHPLLNRYFDRLLSMDVPWTSQDISLIDKLWIRIQKIEKYSYIFQPLFLVNIYLAFIGSSLGIIILIHTNERILQDFYYLTKGYCVWIGIVTLIGFYFILRYNEKSSQTPINFFQELSLTYHINRNVILGIVLLFYTFCTFSLFPSYGAWSSIEVLISYDLYYGDNTYGIKPGLFSFLLITIAISLFILIFLITIRLSKKILIRWKMMQTVNQIISENQNTIRRLRS
jgi:hypothetical protein